MRCSKAEKLIGCYVDSELDKRTAAELQAHLALCESCRHREADTRTLAALLDAWPPVEPRLGYEAFLSRLEQSRRKPEAKVPVLGVPSWSAALLAALSIATGVALGAQAPQERAPARPAEEQVASAIGLGSFGDAVETSLVSGLDEGGAKGASQ